MKFKNKEEAIKVKELAGDFLISGSEEEIELIQAYLNMEEKAKRNEQLSAMESVKILNLIQTCIGYYKDAAKDYCKMRHLLTILIPIMKVLSLSTGDKRKSFHEILCIQQKILKKLDPNITDMEQTIEYTKDNLTSSEVQNTIEFYKEMVKYSKLAINTSSLIGQIPEIPVDESYPQVQRLSTEVHETQQKINQLTRKPNQGVRYGSRKK